MFTVKRVIKRRMVNGGMVRIGIAGTGSTFGIAHYHALGIIRDGRACVSAVYSSSPEKAAKWVNDHNLTARVCTSYEELLSETDAVVICTPNSFHCEMALQAMRADRHVLLEKPVAVRDGECAVLREAFSNYRKVNMVGFTYRFSSAVETARRIISNTIGEIYLFSAWLGGRRLANPSLPLEWRMRRDLSGSGALGDFGSHAVDLADFLCSQRYDEVSCMTGTCIEQRKNGNADADVENDDIALFMGKGKNGMGSFSMSRIGMVEPRFLVTGEGGLLEIDLAGDGHVSYMEKKKGGGYSGEARMIESGRHSGFREMIESQMSAFLDSIEGAGPPVADIAQGCYVASVLLAAEKSSLSACHMCVV